MYILTLTFSTFEKKNLQTIVPTYRRRTGVLVLFSMAFEIEKNALCSHIHCRTFLFLNNAVAGRGFTHHVLSSPRGVRVLYTRLSRYTRDICSSDDFTTLLLYYNMA